MAEVADMQKINRGSKEVSGKEKISVNACPFPS